MRVLALGNLDSTERAGRGGRLIQINAAPSHTALQQALREAIIGGAP